MTAGQVYDYLCSFLNVNEYPYGAPTDHYGDTFVVYLPGMMTVRLDSSKSYNTSDFDNLIPALARKAK